MSVVKKSGVDDASSGALVTLLRTAQQVGREERSEWVHLLTQQHPHSQVVRLVSGI